MIVVDGGVLTSDGTKTLEDVGIATVIDKEVADVEDLRGVDGLVDVIVLGAGFYAAPVRDCEFSTISCNVRILHISLASPVSE
jgi:hypothetical protein